MVLLDMMTKKYPGRLIVAHFDHGIRDDSAADARFVAALAGHYQVPFVTKREELGQDASEATARERRYAFLRAVAEKEDAKIVTAHHQDDIIETIVINLIRGTGWRGLAVMGDDSIERPLAKLSKVEIYRYALEHSLEWVEDHTNASDRYLRNRVRRQVSGLLTRDRKRLLELYDAQCANRELITHEVGTLASNSRYFMTMIDETVASELLRAWLDEQGLSLTRPQRLRLLYAIKTAKPGHMFEAGPSCKVTFTAREFIVKDPL